MANLTANQVIIRLKVLQLPHVGQGSGTGGSGTHLVTITV